MKKLLVALLSISLFACGTNTSDASVHVISSQDAMEMMENESDYVIVDVRTPEEFNASHIPNAINIPVETIEDKPQELSDVNQLILIYCRSGNRSNQAANKLAQLGYTNLYDFGGIMNWTGEIVSE